MCFSKVSSKCSFTNISIFIVGAALALTGFWGCRKDMAQQYQPESQIQSKIDPITVDEARNWFVKQYGKTHTISLPSTSQSIVQGNVVTSSVDNAFIIDPKWTDAAISDYLKSSPLLIVPVRPIDVLTSDASGYSLMFFRDTTNALKTRLQVYVPDSAYLTSHEQLSVNDFSGIMYQIDMQGKGRRFFLVENGKFTARGYLMGKTNALQPRIDDIEDEGFCSSGGCADKIGSWTSQAWGGIISFFSSVSSSIGGGFVGGSLFGSVINTNPVGGGSGNLANEIDNTLFGQYPGRSFVFSLNLTGQDKSYLRANPDMWDQISDFCTLKKGISKAEKGRIVIQQLEFIALDPAYENAVRNSGFTNAVESATRYLSAGFSNQEFVNLFKNPSLFSQVDEFLTKYKDKFTQTQRLSKIRNSTNSPTETIANLKGFVNMVNAFESELTQLSSQNAASVSSSGDMDILMKIFGKILGKKIGKVIPFVGTGLGVEAAWSAYRLGNYGEAAFELAGVAMDFLPVGVILETGWTMVDIAYTAFKAYKPIIELGNFLVSNKNILEAFVNTIDDLNLFSNLSLLPKLTPNSASQFLVSLGGHSVDDFLYSLSQQLGTSWQSTSWGKLIELSPTFKIAYYPIDGSFQGPAISIQLNGITFKIRLQ